MGKKQKNVGPMDDRRQVGDQDTFVALDPDTKLIPCWLTGKRTAETRWRFVADLKARPTNHIQLSSGAFEPYYDAVDALSKVEDLRAAIAAEVRPGKRRCSSTRHCFN